MPQKHPPAITAVCSPGFDASEASVAGPGTAAAEAFPAVHATVPTIKARNNRKTGTENLNIQAPHGRRFASHLYRVMRQAKVSRGSCLLSVACYESPAFSAAVVSPGASGHQPFPDD